MLSPSPTWWMSFIERLRFEPLAELATEYGASEAELIERLVDEGQGMAADLAPWWPELLRLRGTMSIRGLARHFHTEPRRIRRGMARMALRVGGRDLEEGEGAAKLAAYADLLGKERDGALAKAAGVIPEAVQGERRRLDIAPYRQRRRVRLSRDEEEWIRGPRKLRRERYRPEAESLQVVRRPSRTTEPAREPVIAVRAPLSRPAPRAAEPLDRAPFERAPSERPFADRPFPERPFSERPFSDRPVAERADRAPAEARRGQGISAGDFYAEARRWDSGRADREHEIDRLLQPTRQNRDGRMRIVRSEPARPVIEEPAPLGVIRRRVVEARPPVEARPAVEPEPVRRPVRTSPTVTRPAPITRPAAPAPRPAAPVAPTVVRSPVVRSSPRAESAAPAVVAEVAPVVELDLTEWLVYVPGREDPIRLRAADIASAASLAATMVPARLLARASIWRADGDAPAPDLL